MRVTDEFERKLMEGELDPLVRSIAEKVKARCDLKNETCYEIEDLMQEAYLRMIELIKADKYDSSKAGGASKQTFMYTCARNHLVDIERACRRKKYAMITPLPEIFKEYEKREAEKDPDKCLGQIEQVLTEMSVWQVCVDLEVDWRRRVGAGGKDAPSAELLYMILTATAEGKTRKQIGEELGISISRLREIRRVIYAFMRDEKYETNVRDAIGGSHEHGRTQHKPL